MSVKFVAFPDTHAYYGNNLKELLSELENSGENIEYFHVVEVKTWYKPKVKHSVTWVKEK